MIARLRSWLERRRRAALLESIRRSLAHFDPRFLTMGDDELEVAVIDAGRRFARASRETSLTVEQAHAALLELSHRARVVHAVEAQLEHDRAQREGAP